MTNVAAPLMELSEPLSQFRAWTLRAVELAGSAERHCNEARLKLEASSEKLAVVETGLTTDDVRAALRDGDVLTPRQRRFCVNRWPAFANDEIIGVVADDVLLFRALRLGLFRYFPSLQNGRLRLVAHVLDYERRSGDFFEQQPIDRWISQGPADLAARLHGSPELWHHQLAKLGFRPSWEVADVARVEAFRRWLESGESGARLAEIESSPADVKAVFLPPRVVSVSSGKLQPVVRTEDGPRFWVSPDAPRIVGFWLSAARRSPAGAAAIDARLLESELRDPLGPDAHQQRWRDVAAVAIDEYQALLGRLARNDIEFFFRDAHGSDAKERGQFWLRYLGSVTRTKCFLSRKDRDAVRTLERASDPEFRMALQRAGRVASGDSSAFIMWFDDLVVVEFSRTGNATYVCSRAAFDNLRKTWDSSEIDAPDSLKRKSAGRSLSHHSGWQSKFAQELGFVSDQERRNRAYFYDR